MRRSARFLVLAALLAGSVLSCLPTQKGENPNLTGQTVGLTILATTDIHSRLLPYDLAPLKTDSDLGLAPEAPPYGGVARLASLLKRERARADRVLQLDSGDYFQGGPIFNANDGEPEVRWMSQMGYDAVVMGNHEFDKGVQNFADKIQRFASYPLLAANYLWENTSDPNAHGLDKVSSPYTLVNVRGIRTAIIGMGSIGSMYGLMDGGNSLQAVPLEQNETVRAYVELLKPTVDFVVILSHLGLTEDQDLLTGYDAYYPYDNAKQFMDASRGAARWVQLEPPPAEPGQKPNTFPDGTIRVFIPGVSGIDVVMGGHLHVVLNPPQVIRDPSGRPVLISHNGAFAKYLGRLDLQVEMPPARPEGFADDSPEMQAWYKRAAEGAEIVSHSYNVFPVDAIWCDDEARSWRKNVQFDQFKDLISRRPTIAADPASCKQRVSAAITDPALRDRCLGELGANVSEECSSYLPEDCVPCRIRLWNLLPDAIAERCIKNYDEDFRTYECDKYFHQGFSKDPTTEGCLSRIERCTLKEDRRTTDLLAPYINTLDQTFALPRIFAFAPRDVARRNSSTGGDSPLGNMTAESMRVRRRVEAEFALTNTLGIRDNIYAGPITLESMFNVFPFENTINIMYLSGAEAQELTDYVASRSAERGCQAQAQVSGVTFTMDCAQAQENQERYACETDADCAVHGTPKNPNGWRCTDEKVCWANTSYDLKIAGKPVDPNASYKIAVNDYIAKGGSGFKVLKRNTTRIETGISLRDSLIDWLRGQCNCEEILGLTPGTTGQPEDQRRSAAGYSCARAFDGDRRIIDPVVINWCQTAKQFKDFYKTWSEDQNRTEKLAGAPVLPAGRCACQDIINGDQKACGHITVELRNFCSAPTMVPIAIGEEDGRIGRRVK